MTNMEKLQAAWDAKDLSDSCLKTCLRTACFETNDCYFTRHKTLTGEHLDNELTAMVLDEETVSSDFRIVYENDELCGDLRKNYRSGFWRTVSIVQLWRDGQIYESYGSEHYKRYCRVTLVCQQPELSRALMNEQTTSNDNSALFYPWVLLSAE